MYRSFFKPLLDFIAALLAVLVFSPVLLVVGVLLSVFHQGSPFFIQSRPGMKGKIFKIVKFKTMSDARDAKGELLPDAERLSGFGKFVRSTSLDELPQLFNVLAGQMSLVGPRPLLPEYLPLYTPEQNKRHDVKPGITGWAQVNGRNTISWEEKFKLDVYYVNHLSFALDLSILILTLKKVLRKDDIAAEGHTSMPRFDKKENNNKD